MQLKTYASGDGSLSVCWEKDNQSFYSDITLDHVKELRDREYQGWLIVKNRDYFYLVHPYTFLGENQIMNLITNDIYTLEINYELSDFVDFKVYIEHSILGRIEVKNWSIRSSVRWFLRNKDNKHLTVCG